MPIQAPNHDAGARNNDSMRSRREISPTTMATMKRQYMNIDPSRIAVPRMSAGVGQASLRYTE